MNRFGMIGSLLLSIVLAGIAMTQPPGDGKGKGGKGKDRGEPKGAPPEIKPGPKVSINKTLKVIPPGTDPTNLAALSGDATEGVLGDLRKEHSGRGLRFPSGEDINKDGANSGSATWTVKGIKPSDGRWYRFRIRAQAQDDFLVAKDDLYLQVDFYKEDGKNPLDHVKKSIYEQVERERKDLADAGTHRNLGLATWRYYTLDFRTPFPEIDTLRLSVGYGNGVGKPQRSEFWISEVEILSIPDPTDYLPPKKADVDKAPPALSTLVKLGGRWYYDPRGGSKELPKQFDHTNADRLYYLTDRLETPFAGNTTSWLRRGYLDRGGKTVEKDQFVSDSVILTFTDKHLVMKSKNLPNHPTAVFPDRARLVDGNPNYIQEKADTWYIPLEPKENPKHIAMDEMNTAARNANRALNMGPIGVAVNGVVFYNPFDASAVVDAIGRLDRCCGHPSPNYAYHYHKYPVCVNTPWADEGVDHSPLIGFAFDGFPIYGPYEAAGELAKDSKGHPLNEFNLHKDEQRGWHYHVTPGKFPHVLGGYWGEMDPKNRGGRGPR